MNGLHPGPLKLTKSHNRPPLYGAVVISDAHSIQHKFALACLMKFFYIPFVHVDANQREIGPQFDLHLMQGSQHLTK